MAICLFTKKCYDGAGDVVQAAKVADLIYRFLRSSGIEAFQNEAVFLVVKNNKDKEIAHHFVKAINPQIQVKEISEFKKENHQINCCLETSSSTFDWRDEISFAGKVPPPVISLSEYNVDDIGDSVLKILAGFGKAGVIPSPVLLAATENEAINTEALKNAFEQLDLKIKPYLGQDFDSYQAYRAQRDFTYQYSHDGTNYPTFYSDCMSDDPYSHGAVAVKGREYTPVEFFLQEHVMLMGNNSRSQDVLCIGDNSEKKRQALAMLQEELIKKGYTKISFVDLDKQQEEIIHETHPKDLITKEYRVLYSKSMPFSTMQFLPLLAVEFVGVTGDQSVVEAMSANKLVSYECVSHKKEFAQRYLICFREQLSEEDLQGTSKEEILLLIKLLIKPSRKGAYQLIEYKADEVARLLSNKNTINVIKRINRKLVERSSYCSHLKELLERHVLPYIQSQPPNKSIIKNTVEQQSVSQTLPTAEPSPKNPEADHQIVQKIAETAKQPRATSQELKVLLRALHEEVRKHKTQSKQWENRFNEAEKLYQLIHKREINQEDIQLITDSLQVIKQNKPSWSELSVITKILDIISLGIVPLIRAAFFSDKTMKCLVEIEKKSLGALSEVY